MLPAEEVAELVETGDLESLRSINEVEGVAVDMQTLLDAAEPALDRRLQTLGDLVDSDGLDPASLGEQVGDTARTVLEQSKYEIGGEGLLDRLGSLLLAWLNRFLDWLTASLGGPTNAALVAIGIVVLVGIAAFTFLARRRSAVLERELSLERLIAEGGDPKHYEDAAADAAAAGAFDEALRYRFLAGLLRLDLVGRITFRPGLTTGEIADRLGDPQFDHLMDTFNDVAYGGRHADAGTYADAVETWHDLLERSSATA